MVKFWTEDTCFIGMRPLADRSTDIFAVGEIANVGGQIMEACMVWDSTGLGGELPVGRRSQFIVTVQYNLLRATLGGNTTNMALE